MLLSWLYRRAVEVVEVSFCSLKFTCWTPIPQLLGRWSNLERESLQIYWVGQKVHLGFFVKWKTHFSFSTTVLIWIFWVCRLSLIWYNVDCSQLMSWFDHYQFQLVYPIPEHRPARDLQHQTLQTTFDSFDQSQHLLPTLHKSFFAFQLHFYLS